jgi:hypothetical protein
MTCDEFAQSVLCYLRYLLLSKASNADEASHPVAARKSVPAARGHIESSQTVEHVPGFYFACLRIDAPGAGEELAFDRLADLLILHGEDKFDFAFLPVGHHE